MARSSTPRIHLRRLAREYTLQLLYQWDLSGQNLSSEQMDTFWDQAEDMNELMGSREWRKTRPTVEKLVQDIIHRRGDLDARIEKQARDWKVSRMPVVDRNILRLAVYELHYCPEVPTTVAIHEAVGLAKAFAGEDSTRFINGLIDAIAKQLPPEPPSASTPDTSEPAGP